MRLALWVAVIEGIIVAVDGRHLTKWTVLVIAVIVLAFYMRRGPRT